MFVLPDRDRHNKACREHPKIPNSHGFLTRPCGCDLCLACPACLTLTIQIAVDVTAQNRKWQQNLPDCDHAESWWLHGDWQILSCPNCGSSSPDNGKTWRPSPDDADMPTRFTRRRV